MSAKMKRRARHDRRKQALTRRREDSLFFGRGVFPPSATAIAMCSCGARAFGRGGADLADFDDAHAWCDEDLTLDEVDR